MYRSLCGTHSGIAKANHEYSKGYTTVRSQLQVSPGDGPDHYL